MKTRRSDSFFGKLLNKKEHFPWSGQLELTYACGLDCVHCYCKGSESQSKELTTKEWIDILDKIHNEGCMFLTLTGGDPLVRKDFLEIYAYAKAKGFIVTIFTNGYNLTDKIINYLIKSPPVCIEITLNGVTAKTYEGITRVPGSFNKVVSVIKKIAASDIRLILKSNCLEQNKDEVAKVKAFTEELLGKPSEHKYRFKYDPMIYPRLNGDKTPTHYRLSFEELVDLRKQDKDIWEEYDKGLHADFPEPARDKKFLYRCNSWMTNFFINPFGQLKFCGFSNKYSIDLKTTNFKEGFYSWPERIFSQQFKTNSKCRDCTLRTICYHCPARASLETENEETPVDYYCQLAKQFAKQKEGVKDVQEAKI